MSRLFKELKNGVRYASGIRSLPKRERDKRVSRPALAYPCVDQVHRCALVPTLHYPHMTCVYEVLERLGDACAFAIALYDLDRLDYACDLLK